MNYKQILDIRKTFTNGCVFMILAIFNAKHAISSIYRPKSAIEPNNAHRLIFVVSFNSTGPTSLAVAFSVPAVGSPWESTSFLPVGSII